MKPTMAVKLCLVLSVAMLTGCAGIVQKASDRVAAQLQEAILSNDDPATVGEALPAYLLLLDGLIAGQKPGEVGNAGTLIATSKLYSAYAGNFVANDKPRSRRLADRAMRYAKQAVCLNDTPLCAAMDQDVDSFTRILVDNRDIDGLYALASAWTSLVQADTDDWGGIADLPKIEQLFLRVVELDQGHLQGQAYEQGQAFVYLGVLNSLRPEAVGGKPEQGRKFFEEAIKQSGGKNLYAKTLMAEYYARLVFDQELHDRLLDEVLAADPVAPQLTLINRLAQQRAAALRESGKDYF